MAQLGTTFDPSTAPQDDRSFDLMPAGWQPAHCIESDAGPTKQGGGLVASFTWEILEGPFKGRKIWQRINVINQNAQAQEIGQRELGSLCKALGLGPITDTTVVHFKPLQIRVGVEK